MILRRTPFPIRSSAPMRASSVRAPRRAAFVAAVTGLVFALPLAAQAPTKAAQEDPLLAERYIAPPDAIARLVTAPRETAVSYTAPSPGARRWFLRNVSDGMPTLAQMGKTHYNLAGFQIDPAANRARSLTTRAI